MLKLFLWFRYVRKKRIVLLSIAAVALSCALMIVVDSLFTGYIDALKRSAVANVGDVFLWLGGLNIERDEKLFAAFEELDEVEAAAPFDFGAGLLYLDKGDVREVTIQGLEPEREARFADWRDALLRQRAGREPLNFEVPEYPGEEGCWVGINVVAEPNEKTDRYDLADAAALVGARVVLTTTDAGQKRKVIKLRISDIALTQTHFGDKTLYLPYGKYFKILYGQDRPEFVPAIKLKLADGVDAAAYKTVVRERWQRFAREQLGLDENDIAAVSVRTMEENLGSYFGELHKQMAVLLLIFGVICSAVILLIFCIFYMIVETKKKDIAIMKSCGAGNWDAAWIFLGFSLCVGLIGSAAGVIVGCVITHNINTIEDWIRIVLGLKLWRSSSYLLNEIPNQVDWPGVWPIVLTAVVGSALGALIPAVIAARTKPVEILRYE